MLKLLKTPAPVGTRYVRRARIKAGDVLLLRGPGLFSKAIAVATEGVYSHAALFYNDCMLYEADDSGSGFTFLPLIHATVDGEHVEWLELPVPVTTPTVVLRHPHLADLDVAKFDRAFRRATTTYYAEPYSKLDRLADASRLPDAFRPLFRRVLRLWDDRKRHELQHGIFCSELIGLVFKEIDLPLFEREPNNSINPNDLAPPNSQLLVVEDALVPLSESKSAAKRDLAAELGEKRLTRDELIASTVDAKTVATVSESLAIAVKRTVDDVANQSRVAFDDTCHRICDALFDAIDKDDVSSGSSSRITQAIESFMVSYPRAKTLLNTPAACDDSHIQALVDIYRIPLVLARQSLRRALAMRHSARSQGGPLTAKKVQRMVFDFKELAAKSSSTANALFATFRPVIADAKWEAVPVIAAHAIVRIPRALVEGSQSSWWQLHESRRVKDLGRIVIEVLRRKKDAGEAPLEYDLGDIDITTSFPNDDAVLCLEVSGRVAANDALFATNVLAMAYSADACRREHNRKREIATREEHARQFAESFHVWVLGLQTMPTPGEIQAKVLEALRPSHVEKSLRSDPTESMEESDKKQYIVRDATLGPYERAPLEQQQPGRTDEAASRQPEEQP
jgi:hypothetical protein